MAERQYPHASYPTVEHKRPRTSQTNAQIGALVTAEGASDPISWLLQSSRHQGRSRERAKFLKLTARAVVIPALLAIVFLGNISRPCRTGSTHGMILPKRARTESQMTLGRKNESSTVPSYVRLSTTIPFSVISSIGYVNDLNSSCCNCSESLRRCNIL